MKQLLYELVYIYIFFKVHNQFITSSFYVCWSLLSSHLRIAIAEVLPIGVKVKVIAKEKAVGELEYGKTIQ